MMKIFFKTATLLLMLFICSCNANSSADKQKELNIKQKKLELKAKEIRLQQQNSHTKDTNTKSAKSSEKINNKKLRYLFFANGGIVGYFNDGTYTGCPRCDFCKSNILAMFSADAAGTYLVQNNGSLLLNNGSVETPIINSNGDKWALINYKWYIKPPQN